MAISDVAQLQQRVRWLEDRLLTTSRKYVRGQVKLQKLQKLVHQQAPWEELQAVLDSDTTTGTEARS